AGLGAAGWHDVAGPAARGGFGGLSWVGIGVAPLLGVGIWLAYRRPQHPQARRLLLMGGALAVNVGVEGLVRDAAARSGPGSWLWWPNLVYQYSGVLALIAGVLL